ncbi:hypothetical protein SKAU_G00154800 [Synaphobranchus kaupii]|uniref:Uncharacterized protein n=1 Tax=Synaphobranchus kaupii TaxID=118154 RepID=A0A9Q1FHW8_SYNKA|nr:hypothetical protein SKAU_G00154800 [Synaphobranchus kaupii]
MSAPRRAACRTGPAQTPSPAGDELPEDEEGVARGTGAQATRRSLRETPLPNGGVFQRELIRGHWWDGAPLAEGGREFCHRNQGNADTTHRSRSRRLGSVIQSPRCEPAGRGEEERLAERGELRIASTNATFSFICIFG